MEKPNLKAQVEISILFFSAIFSPKKKKKMQGKGEGTADDTERITDRL